MKQIVLALNPIRGARGVSLPKKVKQRVTEFMADFLIHMMKAQSDIAEDTDERK